MEKIILIILIAFGIIYEYFKVRSEIETCNQNEDFAIDFHNKLLEYVETHDDSLYTWLLKNSTKLQNDMGNYGILASFIPPYAHYQITNYQVIVNGVEALNNEIRLNSLLHNKSYQVVEMVRNSIIRYTGKFDLQRKNLHIIAKNPIKLFSRFMKRLTYLPIYILAEFGLLSPKLAKKIYMNIVFKFISNLIAFIAFFSAVVTIVLGWSDFMIIINNFIDYLLRK